MTSREIMSLTDQYILHTYGRFPVAIDHGEGATLYVTAAPCIECAKLIIQAGIKRVVFSEYYRIADGLELLKKAGVECEYIDDSAESAE